jgi:acylphosphatase
MSAPADDVATLHALVRGRVQGVGFRFFVVGQARRLALAGRVRNLPDGGVEVLARGDRTQLEELARHLRQGPRLSEVEDVRLEWGVPCPWTGGFDVDF